MSKVNRAAKAASPYFGKVAFAVTTFYVIRDHREKLGSIIRDLINFALKKPNRPKDVEDYLNDFDDSLEKVQDSMSKARKVRDLVYDIFASERGRKAAEYEYITKPKPVPTTEDVINEALRKNRYTYK